MMSSLSGRERSRPPLAFSGAGAANSTAEECATAPLDMAKPVISRDADGSCARRIRDLRTDDSHRVHGDGS